MKRPRLTGDVRSGFEVTMSMVPWVSTPPRGFLAAAQPRHRIALHAIDPVMLRQPFVQERVVAVEQLNQAVVLADDVLEEHLGFLAHGLPQVAP